MAARLLRDNISLLEESGHDRVTHKDVKQVSLRTNYGDPLPGGEHSELISITALTYLGTLSRNRVENLEIKHR